MALDVHHASDTCNVLIDVTGLPPNTRLMERDLRVDVRPSREPRFEFTSDDHEMICAAAADPQSVQLPVPTLNAFAKAQARYAEISADSENQEPKPGDDVVVVPLGTSSAVPNRYRNSEPFSI